MSSSIDTIREGVFQYQQTEGAVLLDVRTSQEYLAGHIPAAKNVDVARIDQVGALIPDKDTPVFVYCKGGMRARKAREAMESMGYTNVKNIGGFDSYIGLVEK